MNIGIDVGGTNLKAGLVDEKGTLLAVSRMPLGEFVSPGCFAETLSQLACACAQKAGIDPRSVESAGIGIPGSVCGGTVLYTCNIPLRDVPLAELFQRRLPIPVLLGNDADCAAVGEYFCGAGRGTHNFLVVTLGTGVGAGMILNGKLYTGMGAAGEAGHMVIAQGGECCTCGRRGCWEQYASATGLIRMTKAAMAADPGSALHAAAEKNGAVDGRTPFEAAQQGDPAAVRVCAQYAEFLAAGLTNLVNLLHPERIALGGGVAAAPEELLLAPVRRIVGRECYARHGEARTEIVCAELGNDAGIIGAALLNRAV